MNPQPKGRLPEVVPAIYAVGQCLAYERIDLVQERSLAVTEWGGSILFSTHSARTSPSGIPDVAIGPIGAVCEASAWLILLTTS